MYITTNELKQKNKGRINALKSWCKEHGQNIIPKLIQHASASGGIREDVLSFLEQNRECTISKDMQAAFEKLLATDAQAGWYELAMRLGARGNQTASRDLMDEALSMMRAGIPLGLAAHALECSTVDELIQIRRLYEQESMRDRIHSLKEDADYFRQLYKDSHFELDKMSLELARVRRKNKKLERQLKEYECILPYRQEPPHNYGRERDMPQKELSAKVAQSEEEPEEGLSAKVAQSEEEPEEGLNAKVAQSEEEPEEELSAKVALSQEKLEEHLNDEKETSIQVFDSTENKKRNKAIALFAGLVKKIRARRFRNKTQSEQKREIALTMAQNGYDSGRQRLVLDALKAGHVSWELIYSHVYDGAGMHELETLLSETSETSDGQTHELPHED